MARTIIVLIAALFAAPASALPDLSPLDPTGPDGADALEADALQTDALQGKAAVEAVQVVQDVLRCQKAVRVDLEWWTGTSTDQRMQERELLATLTEIVTRIVGYEPITRTTTETIGRATGLLGPLQPLTRTVTTVVGHEAITEREELRTQVPVSLEWQEEYVVWTHHEERLFLTLPAGLGLMAEGEGEVVDICDPKPVLHALPDVCGTGGWCALTQPKDGWHAHVPTVRLAQVDDTEALPVVDAEGMIVGGTPLLSLMEEAGIDDAFVLPEAEEDVPAPPVSSQEVLASEVDVAPTGAAALGAMLAGVVGLLGAIRRFGL